MDESIDARERLQRLGTGSLGQPVGSWEQEKEWLIAQGKRAVERWHDARSRLKADWVFLGDFRPIVCPVFEFDPEDEVVARQCRVGLAHYGQNELPVFFLAWERCPITKGIPNPYEPLISIWESGGSFRREGNLWELSGRSGPVGGIGWPSGAPHAVAPSPSRPRGMSEAEWEKRRKRAEAVRKWSTGADGQPLPVRSVKLVLVLILVGFAFVAGALMGWDDPSKVSGSSQGGLANQYLGPHGDAITMGLLGALLLGWGVWLLVKEARKAQAIRKGQTATPYKARC